MNTAIKATSRKNVCLILGTLFLTVFVIITVANAQTKFDVKAKTVKQAIEYVVMANRILANEGICDYLGHVSIRNPENSNTFFIARSVAPELVTAEDILELNFQGEVVTKTDKRPYRESVIHGAIYKARPDVNAVVHTHPMESIVFSVLNVPVKPLVNTASQFWEGVPVYDEYDFVSEKGTGMLVTTVAEGDRVAKRLGNRIAVLMRGHGFTVAAASIPDVVLNTVNLRDNMVIQMAAMQLGKPKYMPPEEAKKAAQAFSIVGTERAWNYWVFRAKKAMPDLK